MGVEDPFEQEKEIIPSVEEVKYIFEKILEGKEYKILRQKEDEKGLYFLEIRVETEDGWDEYSYMRKGRYKEGESSETSIYVAQFGKDGMPFGGEDVGECIEGEWKIKNL